MLASDADIDQCLRKGMLQVAPTEPELLQPASIDLRLDHRFRTYLAPLDYALRTGMDPLGMDIPAAVIDPAQDNSALMDEVEVPAGEAFLLAPGAFALGATVEQVKVSPELAVKLEGKSSLGRLGLLVHATAGWVDPGFHGHITLELWNASPYAIKLWPGMTIAQIAVMALNTPARRPYGTGALNSRYQGQRPGPQTSQGWLNFRTWPTRQPTPQESISA